MKPRLCATGSLILQIELSGGNQELTCGSVAKDQECDLFFKGIMFLLLRQSLVIPTHSKAMQRKDKFRLNDFSVKQGPTGSL